MTVDAFLWIRRLQSAASGWAIGGIHASPSRAARRWRHAAILAGLLALLDPSGPMAAGLFYVDGDDPACSNSGPGSSQVPYCRIGSAASARGGPGTTLMVRPATYREQVTVPASGSAGSPFVIEAEGSPVILDGSDDYSQPGLWSQLSGDVWLAAGVSTAPVQVFLDGERMSPFSVLPEFLPPLGFVHFPGEGLYVNAGGGNPGDRQVLVGRRSNGFRLNGRTWVAVRGFVVTRTDDNGIYLLGACNDNEVTGNTVSLTGGSGIAVKGCARALVSSNTVSRTANMGIYLMSGTTGSTIQDNESFLNARPTVRASNGIRADFASNCVIQRNRLHDNQDSGIQLNHSTGMISRQNLSWNNGDHGIDQLDSHQTQIVGDIVWNNFKDGFSLEGGTSGARISNIISVNNGLTTSRYNLWVDPISTAGFASDYNVFWNPSGEARIRFVATTYQTVAAFTAATGLDPHSIQSDPLFTDPAGGDFHLLSGSPAIDSADASVPAWPGLDAHGNPRVDEPDTPNQGIGIVPFADRGAFEYGDCALGGGDPCGVSELGECALGASECSDGGLVCVGSTDPAPELCDGLDNDCDGLDDDGFGVGDSCSVGVGSCAASGARVCSQDGLTSVCDALPGTPVPEACDGLDNDCDGLVDNAPAPPGSPELTLAGGQLSWTSVLTATHHDIVLGELGILFGGMGLTASVQGCLAAATAASSLPAGQDPATGSGSWFLVRPRNCGGPGSYDTGQPDQVGSRDPAIGASPLACP